MTAYSEYQEKFDGIIKGCLQDMGCQPVLFVGSGVSSRYAGGPSWKDLLRQVIDENPLIQEELPYLVQREESLPKVGSALVPKYHEYAWGMGREQFPSNIFEDTVPRDIYLKHAIASVIARAIDFSDDGENSEILALRNIRPHSVITTNYDQVLELIYPDLTPIIGQKIIRANNVAVGEIFKIHGCVSEPQEIVVTDEDYEGWCEKRKYLSAKLLTLFLEHPVVIVGYAAQDPNVISILRDIDEILSSDGSLVSNIFYIVYDEKIGEGSSPPFESVLDLGGGRSMRVNCIVAKDFEWIFSAFAASEGLQNVNPKLLRALLARTYDLVRVDVPKMSVQVDFQTLERAVANTDELPKLLGITSLSDPQSFNAAYPHTSAALGRMLGYSNWHGAVRLIETIFASKGVDIRSSDNSYHISVRSGTSNYIHKYSDAAFDLLRKVRDDEEYDVVLDSRRRRRNSRASAG